MSRVSPKDKEYFSLALELIFGTKNAKDAGYGVYKILKTGHLEDIHIREISQMDSHTNTVSMQRILFLPGGFILVASHISPLKVASTIIFKSPKHGIEVSDTIISEGPFVPLKGSQVLSLASLIKSLHEKESNDLFIIMNEFPNICRELIKNVVKENWK